jgi:flagellar biosynthetic protein FliP
MSLAVKAEGGLLKGQGRQCLLAGMAAFFLLILLPQAAFAATPIPSVNIGIGQADSPQQVSTTLQIVALLTVLTLAPSIVIMTTSFVRIVVVMGFLRNALSTQNVPPNQVVIALSLFLTFYIMAPYWGQANEQGIQPYLAGQITQEEALNNTMQPIREFMLKQTRESDLALFVNLSDAPRPDGPEDVSTVTLIPAFLISELKTAFQIGFMIYIPFIVIDMIVASTLMSMGMMMLPPVMISLPFKILLFVMVDGWHLLIKSLIVSFK